MKIQDKRKLILDFAKKNNGNITFKQANELIGHTYYCNGNKYVSEILSRLVRAGVLKRMQRGEYKIGGKPLTSKGIPILPELF